MKKCIIIPLICFPFMAVGAPSVRALGIKNAVIGGKTDSKIVPVKMTVGGGSVVSGNTSGSGVARVGSLRARATTTGQAPSATSVSSRFPAIFPTKFYNTVASPKTTSAGSSINNASISGLEENISALENRVTNIENIATEPGKDSAITREVDGLRNDSRFDSIRRVSGSVNPFAGREDPGTTEEPRAWIWIEVPE